MVLYYVDGDFMSRNNIEQDTLPCTLKAFRTVQHRELWASIGHTGTEELSLWLILSVVMVTEEAMGLDDGQYKSWVE
jgi:homogentisate 1,2-dioxygenase